MILTLDSVNDEPNCHEQHSKKTDNAEGEDGGVLTDGMNTQVQTRENERYQQADQTNHNHRLHSTEPVCRGILLAATALLPQSDIEMTGDTPSSGNKPDHV
eukprot:GHVU01214101.1.p2 GENE.GHVU01214101.1~~GHVU01214101.1.p2  ORF type:complete len:101 (-),score=10.85 GHVU01214101.1:303-605(-)